MGLSATDHVIVHYLEGKPSSCLKRRGRWGFKNFSAAAGKNMGACQHDIHGILYKFDSIVFGVE
jgi:hypothetical protein